MNPKLNKLNGPELNPYFSQGDRKLAQGWPRIAPAWSEGHSQRYCPSEGQARRAQNKPGLIQPENPMTLRTTVTTHNKLFCRKNPQILRRPVRNAG
jgi:hypothetical protein